MSKHQRRRVAKRRNMHAEHVKRRTLLDPRLPIALAVVAAPAVLPRRHRQLRAPTTCTGRRSMVTEAG